MSNSQNDGVGLQFHYHAAGLVRDIARRLEVAGYPDTARDLISAIEVAIGDGTQREKAILTLVSMVKPDALAQLDTLITDASQDAAAGKTKESQRLHLNGATPRLTEIFLGIDEILKAERGGQRSELIQVVDRSGKEAHPSEAPTITNGHEAVRDEATSSGNAIQDTLRRGASGERAAMRNSLIRELGPSPTGSQGKKRKHAI